jgi:hypothetical protein
MQMLAVVWESMSQLIFITIKFNSSSDTSVRPMSQRERVIDFFQKVCDDPSIQNKLKAPCPANRQGFANVAQECGYDVSGADLDDYVRFYQFYTEFQRAIERHQAGKQTLPDWLNKWEKHLKKFSDDPLDDRYDTIKRFI